MIRQHLLSNLRSALGGPFTWHEVAKASLHLPHDRVLYATTQFHHGYANRLRYAEFAVLEVRETSAHELAKADIPWTPSRLALRAFDTPATYLPPDWLEPFDLPLGESREAARLHGLYYHLILLGRGPFRSEADKVVRAMGRDHAKWALVQRSMDAYSFTEDLRRKRYELDQGHEINPTLPLDARDAAADAFMSAGADQ